MSRWLRIAGVSLGIVVVIVAGSGLPGVNATPSLTEELHAVSINKGYYPDGVSPPHGEHPMSFAAVRVDRPGKKVCLYLAGAAPVTWAIEASEGTEITEVLLGGDFEQKLADGLADVKITRRYMPEAAEDPIRGTRGGQPSRDVLKGLVTVEGNGDRPTDPYQLLQRGIDRSFTGMARQLRDATGLTITSFNAQYQARKNVPIVVRDLPDRYEKDPTCELHALSIGGGDPGEGEPGLVTAKVDRPGKKVIVFLSSYNSVKWNVETTPGTVVERIILGGYEPQDVDERLAGMTTWRCRPYSVYFVEGTFGAIPSKDVLDGKRTIDDDPRLSTNLPQGSVEFRQLQTDFQFTCMVRQLKNLTGLPLRSFHTQGQAKRDTPIVVRASENWFVADPKVELHGVSIAAGHYPEGAKREFRTHPMSFATVTVDRPGKKIILFLSAYEPVTWDVELSEGTELAGVILGGYYEQKVAERLQGIKTLERSYDGSRRPEIPGTYGRTPSNDVLTGKRKANKKPTLPTDGQVVTRDLYRQYELAETDYLFTETADRLREMTGLEFSSFTIPKSVVKTEPIAVARGD